MEQRRIFMIVGDGMSDDFDEERRTCLSRARTPTLDELARIGVTGYLPVLPRNGVPNSDNGHLSLLGFLNINVARGVFEALGCVSNLPLGAVCARFNLGIVENGILRDRRGHGITTKESRRLLDGFRDHLIDGVDCQVIPTANYRGTIIMKDRSEITWAANDRIEGNDLKTIDIPIPKIHGFGTNGRRFAKILEELEERFRRYQEENAFVEQRYTLLVREIGPFLNDRSKDSFFEKHRMSGAIIAGVSVVRGAGRYLGLSAPNRESFTARMDTDIQGKVDEALRSQKRFCLINLKATDYASHQRNPEEKIRAIELLDRLTERLRAGLEERGEDSIIIVTSDHSTSSITGMHTEKPVATLVSGLSHLTDSTDAFIEDSGAGLLTSMLEGTWELLAFVIEQQRTQEILHEHE
jgi:2,3-bisphosphoglycerate-independent phosphoglycerate mutase